MPRYDPPSFRVGNPALNERVKDFFEYWEKFLKYTRDFLNPIDREPFASIASATTIAPTRRLQPVTGSTTIQTIEAREDFGPVVLLAIDGFSTGTSGNIAAAVALAAGTAKTFFWNPVAEKYFPGG
jgi:hypothetical protein